MILKKGGGHPHQQSRGFCMFQVPQNSGFSCSSHPIPYMGKLYYFTHLDLGENFGVPFPETKQQLPNLLGPKTRVSFRSRAKLIWPGLPPFPPNLHRWDRYHIIPQLAVYTTYCITYIPLIYCPIGWLYITYHLLREPETAIDSSLHPNISQPSQHSYKRNPRWRMPPRSANIPRRSHWKWWSDVPWG